MADLSPLEMIQRNAALVIETAREQFGVTLHYDQESVEWLDEYIERLRQQNYPAEDIAMLINVFGSFVGECIRHQFGGAWEEDQGSWLIRFDANNAAFPFNKVGKQFERGSSSGNSIAGFYTSIPRLFPSLSRKDDTP